MELNHRISRAILVSALLLPLASCMTFNDERVEKTHPTRKAEPPSMVITMVEHRQEGGSPMLDERTQGHLLANALGERWHADGLIGDHGDPDDLDDPDYTLSLRGVSRGNGSLAAAFITGLTFYLIPSSSGNEISLDATLEDHRRGKQYKAEAVNSSTMWQHLIFVPVTPFGLIGATSAQTDLYRYLYTQLEEQGAFGP